MKRVLLTIIFAALMCATAVAQTISGNVKNAGGEGVPFANVILYYQSDSTKIFGGTITDFNGGYEIKDVKQGSYFQVQYPSLEKHVGRCQRTF